MGTLAYNGQAITFSDPTLMNLMVASTARLRRNEPFLLSWHEVRDDGLVRKAVWMHAAADLIWSFDASDPEIDRAAVTAMVAAAGTGAGLVVTDGLNGSTAIAPDRIHEVVDRVVIEVEPSAVRV